MRTQVKKKLFFLRGITTFHLPPLYELLEYVFGPVAFVATGLDGTVSS